MGPGAGVDTLHDPGRAKKAPVRTGGVGGLGVGGWGLGDFGGFWGHIGYIYIGGGFSGVKRFKKGVLGGSWGGVRMGGKEPTS